MNPKVETALNEQIHAEFYSFYLYLSVSPILRPSILTVLRTGCACRRKKNTATQ